ncbi:MAG TPA: 3-phosphoshikimate 1-carboxyvinyltransferase [Anaerolineales bacterium]|nr:3-phosphoshikimate 1-carboxyvinyltransferase [Anaerolineales bacterium]
MQIIPINHSLNAAIHVPGSKSLTNRALLIAALANGKTRLKNALFSDDSFYFAKALQTLGFDIELDEANHEMTITGLGGKIPADRAELYIGNAGTAARFLSAFLTLGNGEYYLDGDARMRERPLGDLVAALTQLGCDMKPAAFDDGRRTMEHGQVSLPIKILASGLPGGRTKIAGHISSQFLSGLLMVAPYAKAAVEIEVTTELNSKPYVDMTIAMMQDFGVELKRQGYSHFSIRPSFFSPLSSYSIESDASAASYFFAAPAICGGKVCVENISRRSKQGDLAFLSILQQMGCVIEEGDNFIEITATKPLKGVEVDMRDLPDTAQTLAVIAPFAASPTRIRGIASARLKETDRIHATCQELARLGIQVEEYEDGMTIHPCDDIRPAIIQTYNDHRMAMAFSLIGLRVPGIVIENPACVSKTFPNFFEILAMLRTPSGVSGHP